MNLYCVELVTTDGRVEGEHFRVAKSPEHCIADLSSPDWKEIYPHIHSIEHMYEFKDYKDCLQRLEICINYTFHQIEQLSIMAAQFADSVINGQPERAEIDQGHASTLSFAANQIEDRLDEVKKYIGALEHMTTEQRGRNRKMGTKQNLTQ